jgi:ElaB/YqjD/DUF883 family membrane-anchored ribosome-binding protein
MATAKTAETSEPDLKKDVEALRADLDALRGDLGQILQTLKIKTGNRAESEIDALRKRIERLAGDVQSSGHEAARVVGEQIEERPFASLAMAFAVGLMLGRLFDRR